MPEQVAKKKRVRKTSNAMLTIRIERTVPAVDSQPFLASGLHNPDFLPAKVVVLEQTLPEAKFDLAKVIKAINGL